MRAGIQRSWSLAKSRSDWDVFPAQPKQATHAWRPRMRAGIQRSWSLASRAATGGVFRRSQNRQLMRGGRA